MWQKLKEHQVFQVAAIYGVISWVLIQIIVTVVVPLQLPPWIDTFVIVLLAIGFPVALIFAYAFDTSPGSSEATAAAESSSTGLSNSQMVFVVGLTGLLFSGTIAYLVVPSETSTGAASSETAQFAQGKVAPPPLQMPTSANKGAIAVLPFVNMSADPEQEYFSDGITEDILTGLQSFQSIPVIARTSTFMYKGVSKDVRVIAKELNADYILEGSVRRKGEDIRITAQLIDSEGNHIWANAFDAPWSEVLKIQDEITTQIVIAIEPEIILSEVDRARHARPTQLDAWDYYLKARADTGTGLGFYDLQKQPITKERNEQARVWALKAVEIDPNFAAGYALLMHIDGTYLTGLAMTVTDEERAMHLERALVNAAKARAMNPFEASVCSCQALLLLAKGNVALAREVQEEALQENPSSAILHAAYAAILREDGEVDRALEEIQYAQHLSPQDVDMTVFLFYEALILQTAGDFEKALDAAQKSLLLSPTNYDAQVVQITTLFALGRSEEARKSVEELYQRHPNFSPNSLRPRPFPNSIAAHAPEHMRDNLRDIKRGEGVALILRELGFQPDT